MRYRLDVVAPTVLDAVRFAGGWVCDRVMAGWDVTVLIGNDEDVRPLEILGAEVRDLESVLESWEDRAHPQLITSYSANALPPCGPGSPPQAWWKARCELGDQRLAGS